MDLSLKNIEWKEFVIENLFDIKIGKNVDGNKINKYSGKTAYITRKESNNGLDGFIKFDDKYLNVDSPVITIGNETSEPFVQNYPFFTGTKVNILIPKSNVNESALLFIAQSLRMHKTKYSYSFTINSTRLRRQKILLPVNSQGDPDFEFMENYMRAKEQEKAQAYKNYIQKRIIELENTKEVIPLSEKDWAEFRLQELFETEKGNQNNMSSLKNGDLPLISAKKDTNGLKDFVTKNNKKQFDKHCLTLNNDGDGGAGISYYQPFDFLLDSHVTALRPKDNLSKSTLLFISRSITKQRDKFGHGYSINNKRLKVFMIMLPINDNHEPDYEYMENYMKQLELNKLKKYLKYKNV